ncbi:hypothetical protein B0T26DRAFT_752246 [Lasiosphaeria miniovina]|uniref:Uncharacterized protein n=1 Tax=Lasiosphaeria miniovina TaxID=1954250 RepID=A0AA40DWM6_9PEZI|nr:uncharacterized protein B0T26DRAFT_752246 [Lasiosphaeria miniovina]KAK0718310.1 hypothetical protein B0T26DRAFT_752246 [Lasiosphaeria miniovina]
MGFLSFLSRKPGDKSKSNGLPKLGSFGSTAAQVATPRVPYSSSGGASSAVHTLPRDRSRFSRTQLSLDDEHAADPVAPAPSISRFREESMERPSTAPPDQGQSDAIWATAGRRVKKTAARGPPPLSFRMLRSSTAAPGPRPSSHGSGDSAPRATFSSHSRSNSIRSDSGRGFKDILDAQSEINPADFKTRVQAAGARDYGEDVAERNMGQNGFELESPHVQAFYAQLNGSQHQQHARNADSLPHRRPTPAIYASGARTKSMTSSSHYPLPKTAAAAAAAATRAPRTTKSSSTFHFPPSSPSLRPLKRPQSIGTYMSSTSLHRANGTLAARHFSAQNGGILIDASRNALVHEGEKFPALSSPIVLAPPKTRHDAGRPPRIPRDSVMLAKKKSGIPLAVPVVDDDEAISDIHSRSERSFSLRPSILPSHHEAIITSSSSTSLPRKRHSLHTLQSSVSLSSFAGRETVAATEFTPLAYPRSKLRRINPPTTPQEAPSNPSASETMSVLEDVSPVDSAPSPLVRGAPSITHKARERPESIAAARGLSVVPVTGSSNLDEFSEHASLRNRSMRGWSASSATPTASDISSNQRPQSPHTANTSINLSSSCSPVQSSRESSLDNGTGLSPKTPQSVAFNIDDYVSSDDDSFSTCQRPPRGEGEEDLLFRDDVGYGVHGTQLPGLFDALSIADGAPQSSPQQKRMMMEGLHAHSLTALSPVYDAGTFGRSRRFILDTAADDDDDDDNYYLDGAEVFLLRTLQGTGTTRLSALHSGSSRTSQQQQQHATAGDVIEEEREGKVDVAAAVKLRKEVKARKRAQALSSSSSRARRAQSAAPVLSGRKSEVALTAAATTTPTLIVTAAAASLPPPQPISLASGIHNQAATHDEDEDEVNNADVE